MGVFHQGGGCIVMIVADPIDDHQARCETRLARLWMLADATGDGTLPRPVATEVRKATNAIIAEAEAAGRAALAATAGHRGELAAETFLLVRLTRLAEAADQAVSAASTMDANGLRRHLHRFDSLSSAMWAVQHAVYG
jgi:hypothetical protein